MYYEISKSAKINELPQLLSFAQSCSTKLALPTKIRHKVLIVVEELFTNTVKHGGHCAKTGYVLLCIGRHQDRLHLQYHDQGLAFNPFTQTPLTPASEPVTEGGVGIQLINRFMDSCHYNRALGHNYLEMIKKL